MTYREPKRYDLPGREMFSLKCDDIEGAQPKKFLSRPNRKYFNGNQNNADNWNPGWGAYPQPHVFPTSITQPETQNYVPSQPSRENSQNYGYQPVQLPDSLDNFQNEYQKKNLNSQYAQPKQNVFSSQQLTSTHLNQQIPNTEPDFGEFSKNYENFYRGYTPANNQRYNFLDTLIQQPKANQKPQSPATFKQDDVHAKHNFGKFFGIENHMTEQEHFQKNIEKFYGIEPPKINNPKPRNPPNEFNADSIEAKHNMGKFYGIDHQLSDEELFQKNINKFYGSLDGPSPLIHNGAGVPNKKFQTYNIISGEKLIHEVNVNERRRSQPENIFQADAYPSPHLRQSSKMISTQQSMVSNDNKYGHFYKDGSLNVSQNEKFAGKKLIRDAGKFVLG